MTKPQRRGQTAPIGIDNPGDRVSYSPSQPRDPQSSESPSHPSPVSGLGIFPEAAPESPLGKALDARATSSIAAAKAASLLSAFSVPKLLLVQALVSCCGGAHALAHSETSSASMIAAVNRDRVSPIRPKVSRNC